MTGPDYGSWYHPSFVRGYPLHLKAITRTAVKKDVIALARAEAAMKEKLSIVNNYDLSPSEAKDATAQLSMKMKVESLLADSSYAEKQGVTSFNLVGNNLPYDRDNSEAAFSVPPSFSYTESDSSRSFKHESLKINGPEIFDEADLVDGQLHQGLIYAPMSSLKVATLGNNNQKSSKFCPITREDEYMPQSNLYGLAMNPLDHISGLEMNAHENINDTFHARRASWHPINSGLQDNFFQHQCLNVKPLDEAVLFGMSEFGTANTFHSRHLSSFTMESKNDRKRASCPDFSSNVELPTPMNQAQKQLMTNSSNALKCDWQNRDLDLCFQRTESEFSALALLPKLEQDDEFLQFIKSVIPEEQVLEEEDESLPIGRRY